MADEPRDPVLEDVLNLHRDLIHDGLHVMVPGQITAYDAALQKATVQPLVRRRHLAEDGETIVVEDMPAIHDCPVVFCGPARGRITWPVAAGDTCEVRFSEAALARWAALGGIVDPADDRHHDLSDAVCQVGLHDFAHVPTDAPTNAIVLHASGGTLIQLGSSSAAQAAVLGTTYRSAEDALLNALVTVVNALADAGPQTVAAGVFAAAVSAFQAAAATYLSTKTKLE